MTDLDALAALEAACDQAENDAASAFVQTPFFAPRVSVTTATLRPLIDAARRVQAMEAERDELRSLVQGYVGGRRVPVYDGRYGDIARRIAAHEARHVGDTHSTGCPLCAVIEDAHRLEAIIDAECMGGGEWGRLLAAAYAERDEARAEVERLRRENDRWRRLVVEGTSLHVIREWRDAATALARIDTDEARQAVAEALDEHDVAETRSDLTQVCACGFDFDPCHWDNPWPAHLAEAAVRALLPTEGDER